MSIKRFEEFVAEIETKIITKDAASVKFKDEEPDSIQGITEASRKVESVMIKNNTSFSMNDIYEYLSGYTTRLNNKIKVSTLKGNYYDTIIVAMSGVSEAGEAILGDDSKTIKETNKKVTDQLKDVYESVISEAKEWEADAHDEHTVMTYMSENVALVAALAANSVKEMHKDMESEAYEACLNKMSESFAKKINESKETVAAVDAEDID